MKLRTDRDGGITSLEVRAFRPDDAYRIAVKLLELGEAQVNALNLRSYRDAIDSSRRQVLEAEAEMTGIRQRLTAFRQVRGDIDPEGSGKAQIGLVSNLRASLAQAESQLATIGASVNQNGPQYIAMRERVRSLRNQLASQSGALAGGTDGSPTIANNLASYEDLRLRQEFASKSYEAAAASLQQARERAARQQLYLVRVVDANRPVKALYPERGRIVLTVLAGLLLAYGIGWLLLAGVREHAI